MVVLAPIRSEPLCRPRSAESSSSAARSTANSASACRDRASPSVVGTTPFGVRLSRRQLTCSSKSRTPFEIAGWLMLRISPAREKLPVRTTVANMRSR